MTTYPSQDSSMCALNASMDSWNDAPCKAAIAMNNKAVDLLARGYGHDAIVILEAARKVMESAVPDPKRLRRTVSATKKLQRDINGALKLTNQIAVHTSFQSVGRCMAHWPKLQVISNQDNPLRIYESLSQETDPAMAFPMTIDTVDYEGITPKDLNFAQAVIWYNCGTAYEVVAAVLSLHHPNLTTNRGTHAGIHKQTKAYRNYIKAQTAMYQDYASSSESTSCWFSRCLLLGMVLTHSLIRSTILLDMPLTEYNGFCHSMAQLMQVVESHRLLFSVTSIVAGAA